jgi:hypothetical protein
MPARRIAASCMPGTSSNSTMITLLSRYHRSGAAWDAPQLLASDAPLIGWDQPATAWGDPELANLIVAVLKNWLAERRSPQK